MDRKTEPEKPKDGETKSAPADPAPPSPEVGGRDGPEPTRYGDWEVGGICTDF
jgi:hypothetical protein